MAVDRFNYGLERLRPEDKIVDFAVSLEALYLHDLEPRERGELRFRLCLRAARFLRSDAPGRHQVFRDLRAAYDARSAIVHGAAQLDLPKDESGRRLSPEQFALVVESYVRESIKAWVRHLHETGDRPVDWHKLILD